MTKEEKVLQEEQILAGYWNQKFKESMVTKGEYIKDWMRYWDAYKGDYFKNTAKPEYKSDLVSNYIFSIVETIRPIMLDNDPKFQSIARNPQGMAFGNDLQEVLSYEWDREGMNTKLYRELITMLVTGTAIFFVPWDKEDKNVKAIPVDPFNIFPDPLATCVDDAEYIMYASYRNVNQLKRQFPKKAKLLSGSQINYTELVHENGVNSRIDNQVLVLEVWTNDYETTNSRGSLKYPKGRVITLCPELGIVLKDIANPYKDGKFPFILLKDYDVPGKFWGEGEVAQLLSPQKYMNELNNAILDNAKSTANMPWVVDKNSGIGKGVITSRPGLILRKNPGTQVDRMQAPNMPGYVINAVEQYKHDMEQISGIFDTLKGNSETGVYTAQGILALQEAGQARIRLKVKLLEDGLGRLGRLWFNRMQQFWNDERWIRITLHDGSYDMKKFRADLLKHDYDIKILAGSTMPVNRGAMLDLMIRLAQTQMPDGQALVDREAVAQYLPLEVKSALLQRMEGATAPIEQQIAELGQQLQGLEQGLQQFVQQDQHDDQATMQTIEQIVQAIEQIKQQIVQVEGNNAKLEEERIRTEQEQKIRDESYNSGYLDAERVWGKEEDPMESVSSDLGEFANGSLALPDDILQGLESMTDDELALLMMQDPTVGELIK